MIKLKSTVYICGVIIAEMIVSYNFTVFCGTYVNTLAFLCFNPLIVSVLIFSMIFFNNIKRNDRNVRKLAIIYSIGLLMTILSMVVGSFVSMNQIMSDF